MRFVKRIKKICRKTTALFLCAFMFSQQPCAAIAENIDITYPDDSTAITEISETEAEYSEETNTELESLDMSAITEEFEQLLQSPVFSLFDEEDKDIQKPHVKRAPDSNEPAYICKIVDNNAENGYQIGDSNQYEHPFMTFKEALTYARNSFNNGAAMSTTNAATIEMLRDYVVTNNDKMVLEYDTDNIILTTAKLQAQAQEAGENYFFTDTLENKDENDIGIAVICRGFDGKNSVNGSDVTPSSTTAMFNILKGGVSAGTNQVLKSQFKTTNIIFDGNGYVGRAITNRKGNLTIGGNTHFRNFGSCNANGEAIYSGEGTLNIGEEDGEPVVFSDCRNSGSSAAGGAAIYCQNGGTYANFSASIINTKFIDCNASGAGPGGGAVRFNGSNNLSVSINGCSFFQCNSTKNSSSPLGGGAIYYQGNVSLEINNCTFEECTTTKSGGAIYNGSSQALMLAGCIFKKCTATTNGGAIYHSPSSSQALMITDSAITECTAQKGAAIYLNNGSATLKGDNALMILSCSASDASGGAVNVNGKSVYYEGNVYVYDNYGTGNLSEQQKNMVLESNSTAIINTTTNGLGNNAKIGVYVTDSQYNNRGQAGQQFATAGNTANGISNVNRFINDRNNNLYGTQVNDTTGIKWVSTTVRICKIIDNNSANGEQIGETGRYEHTFATLKSALNYARTQFNNGAAMSAENPVTIEMLQDYAVPILVSTSAVNTRSRLVSGDLLTLNQSTDNIIITTAKNQAQAQASGETYYFTDTLENKDLNDIGTAILMRGGNGTVDINTQSSMTEFNLNAIINLSDNGGSLTTRNIIFEANNYSGRAIANRYGTALTIGSGTEFRNFQSKGNVQFSNTTTNIIQNGGAIFSRGGILTIGENGEDPVIFSNCTSEGNYGGGAICIHENGNVTITNTTFVNCSNPGELSIEVPSGGAIHSSGNISMTISDCTFTSCASVLNGGAIYTSSSSPLTISDCIFTNCTAEKGAAIYMNSGSTTIKGSNAEDIKMKIESCSATDSNGGAINVVNANCRLYFEGRPIIINNPSAEMKKNVVLEHNTNAIINTTANGLSENAEIGIYVTDAQNNAHGGAGDPFGTYNNSENGIENLNRFVNDRNGLLGEYNEDGYIHWKSIPLNIIEGQLFGDFPDTLPPVIISRDSSFTVQTTVSISKAKIEFSNSDGAVPLPTGTTMILKYTKNDTTVYYFYNITSAVSSVNMTDFTEMGGGNGRISNTDSEYKAQVIVDFSRVSGNYPSGNTLKIKMGTALGTITLTDPVEFTVDSDDSADDLISNTSVSVINLVTDSGKYYTDTNGSYNASTSGRATIWEGKKMALVIDAADGTPLPFDTKLNVKIGGGSKTAYSVAEDGKYIIPLGNLASVSDIQIDLSSNNFPATATSYTLNVALMVSNTLADSSPLNGFEAATGTLVFKSPAQPQPALKIISDKQAVIPGGTVNFTAETINTTEYRITAKFYRKNGNWASKVDVTPENYSDLKTGNVSTSSDAANPTEIQFSFATSSSSNDESYVVIVTVTDFSNNIIMEVPYYFLAVNSA